jgi:Fe(3+) dicitrate transport protein
MFPKNNPRRSAVLLASVSALLTSASVLAQAPEQDSASGELEPVVIVIGERIQLDKIPGSGTVIDHSLLEESHVFTVNEALRKVPGVFTRDEEGFGLRPNIGIRGLNPTRSTKVLLLEDGIPLAYAPYGDNASYYHPPVERFERIEVLKGSGQIAFGPHTVGAVINYITPPVPDEADGLLSASFGNEDFREVHGSYGDTYGNTGFVAHGTYKETDGARENMNFSIYDLNLKVVQKLTERQALTFRSSYYDEDSQVTYSGLTLAEWQDDPRQNPFANDHMYAYRWSTSATHRFELNPATTFLTNAYYTYFNRDWWRQSSNSGQRPNDRSDPSCGGMENLDTTCGNEGRVRQFWTAGVEPRVTVEHGLFGVDNFTEAGARYHEEDQYRIQANGDFPDSREPGTGPNAGIKEDSDRRVKAASAFVQNRFDFGRWTVTPGVRFESIDYERVDNLLGTRGETSVDQWIPGIGGTFEAAAGTVVFAGVHRGFSPPGVADIVTAQGGTVDLDAELSWNYELGVRSQPLDGVSLEPDRAGERRRRQRRHAHERRRDPAAGLRVRGRGPEHGLRRVAGRGVCAPVVHVAGGRRIRGRALQQHPGLLEREGHGQPPAVCARAPARGHGRRAHRIRPERGTRGRVHQRRVHRRPEHRGHRGERPARRNPRLHDLEHDGELRAAGLRLPAVRHREEPDRRALHRGHEPRPDPGHAAPGAGRVRDQLLIEAATM